MGIRDKASHVAQEFKRQLVTLLLGAFGFVAALAWNDAIKGTIESVFPVGTSSLWIKLIYAAVVTLLLVIVSIILIRSEAVAEVEDNAKK